MAWSDIHGHDRWVAVFRHVAARQRLAHAYLFVGPPGVGKRLFALELARALLCERSQPSQLAACGECEACVLFAAGTHPDFFLVGKPPDKNEMPIEVMRELCQAYGLKSARGKTKIAVIDDADDFNDESANCFLKTLEEPPPRSLIILLGTSLEQQLPTIRSRCQVIRFAPLADTPMRAILGKEGVSDPQLASRLVKLAAGSPGQALALKEPELWEFRGKLLRGLAQPRIDSMALAKEFTEFAQSAGKETSEHRQRAALVLKLLVEALGDVLDVHASGSLEPVAPEDRAALQSLAHRAQPDKILALLERCLEAEVHLGRYIQVGLVIEALMDALGRMLES
jgi:DNA polymerase III subunit delta'